MVAESEGWKIGLFNNFTVRGKQFHKDRYV